MLLPNTENDLLTDFEYQELSSKTYKLDIKNNCIRGFCNSLTAIKQAIYKILNTERYESIIYSWNYGIEIKDLYGKPTSYVVPELKRRIKEALLQDDRIENVNNFQFKVNNEVIAVSFTVKSNIGDVDYEYEYKMEDN